MRALKAGQSIREIGPSWHNSKAGTPTMGGLVFIAAAALCTIAGGWRSMLAGNLTHLYVLAFALVFGVIGFLDDFMKVKYKRNLGLTAIQKLALQLAAAGAYLALTGKGLTAGAVILFVNLMNFMIEPVAELPALLAARKAARGLIAKLADALEQDEVQPDGVQIAPLMRQLRLEDVRFSYDGETEILRGFVY